LLEVGEHRVGFDQVLAGARRGRGGGQALNSGDGLRGGRLGWADAGGVCATDDADAGNAGNACRARNSRDASNACCACDTGNTADT
jgi:hypothetical protein